MNAEPTDLVQTVEDFLIRSGMTPSSFGRAALMDPGFVFGLRDGRECRSATRRKVLDYIERWDSAQRDGAAA